jgi:hypothetical protein
MQESGFINGNAREEDDSADDEPLAVVSLLKRNRQKGQFLYLTTASERREN